MAHTDLSIIIPVYNAPLDFLEHCFRSVRTQLTDRTELIIVDDGSTDGSGKFCDVYWNGVRGVTIIHQTNRGAAVARNTGILMAKGNYLTFIDSDDWFLENSFSIFLDEMKSNADLIFFNNVVNGGGRHPKRLEGNLLEIYSLKELKRMVFRKGTIGENCAIGAPWGKLFRRGFLLQNHIFFDQDLRRTQDRMLLLECLECDPVVRHSENEVLCFNVGNEDSLSRGFNYKNIEYLEIYLEKCLKFAQKSSDSYLLTDDYAYLKTVLYIDICESTFFHAANKESSVIRYRKFITFSNQYRVSYGNFDLQRIDGKRKAIAFLVNEKKFGWCFLLFEKKKWDKILRKTTQKLLHI